MGKNTLLQRFLQLHIMEIYNMFCMTAQWLGWVYKVFTLEWNPQWRWRSIIRQSSISHFTAWQSESGVLRWEWKVTNFLRYNICYTPLYFPPAATSCSNNDSCTSYQYSCQNSCCTVMIWSTQLSPEKPWLYAEQFHLDTDIDLKSMWPLLSLQ